MKKKIAIIVTAPIAVKIHLFDLVESLKEDYSVFIMTNLSKVNDEFLNYLPRDLTLIDTKMEREINLFKDLRSLFILILNLKKNNIELSFSLTPKAGLLASLASFVSFIPVRIHVFTGQVWLTKSGLRRFILKGLDRLIYSLSTKVLIDSTSQRDFLLENNIVKEKKSLVLGSGSFCGVDTLRFIPSDEHRISMRKKYNLSPDQIVYLFVGRLKKDKGVFELIESFSHLRSVHKNINLWLLGPDEENIKNQILSNKMSKEGIEFIPFSPNPELFMNAADIFCLPSYREGFGTVIIESASCGIPAIGTRIYGLKDAIEDGITGLLVGVKEIESLKHAMERLLQDHVMRKKMGETARMRAKEEFDQRKVIKRILEFLDSEYKKVAD